MNLLSTILVSICTLSSIPISFGGRAWRKTLETEIIDQALNGTVPIAEESEKQPVEDAQEFVRESTMEIEDETVPITEESEKQLVEDPQEFARELAVGIEELVRLNSEAEDLIEKMLEDIQTEGEEEARLNSNTKDFEELATEVPEKVQLNSNPKNTTRLLRNQVRTNDDGNSDSTNSNSAGGLCVSVGLFVVALL